MDNFNKQLELGKKGEELVIKYLHKNFDKVIDVSNDKKYQDIDVDFLCYKNNVEYKVELKTDFKMEKTHNIFFELSHERKTGTYDGFFYKSKADFLLNLNANTNILYISAFSKRTRIIALQNCHKIRFWDDGDKCYTNGMVMSIRKAKELGVIYMEKQL